MAIGETPNRVTEKAERRRYTPRARKCAGCGNPFKPRSAKAKTCSNACRQRVFRQNKRTRRQLPTTRPQPALTLAICLCCGKGYFVPLARASTQKYCARRCATRAWKLRRRAATEALCSRFGLEPLAASDMLDVRGLANVTSLLNGVGLHYEPAHRAFCASMAVVPLSVQVS